MHSTRVPHIQLMVSPRGHHVDGCARNYKNAARVTLKCSLFVQPFRSIANEQRNKPLHTRLCSSICQVVYNTSRAHAHIHNTFAQCCCYGTESFSIPREQSKTRDARPPPPQILAYTRAQAINMRSSRTSYLYTYVCTPHSCGCVCVRRV